MNTIDINKNITEITYNTIWRKVADLSKNIYELETNITMYWYFWDASSEFMDDNITIDVIEGILSK